MAHSVAHSAPIQIGERPKSKYRKGFGTCPNPFPHLEFGNTLWYRPNRIPYFEGIQRKKSFRHVKFGQRTDVNIRHCYYCFRKDKFLKGYCPGPNRSPIFQVLATLKGKMCAINFGTTQTLPQMLSPGMDLCMAKMESKILNIIIRLRVHLGDAQIDSCL